MQRTKKAEKDCLETFVVIQRSLLSFQEMKARKEKHKKNEKEEKRSRWKKEKDKKRKKERQAKKD